MASMKKLKIKTMTNEVFELDFDDKTTVADVKSSVCTQKPALTPPLQKLIYSGKILDDRELVSKLNIKDGDSMVLFVTKPKAAPPTNTTSAAASATVPTSVPFCATNTATNTAAAQRSSTTTAGSGFASQLPSATTSTPSAPAHAPVVVPITQNDLAFAVGPAYEAAINYIVELGFTRDRATLAMRAAYNNADRAVDLLFSDANLESMILASSDAAAQGAQPGQNAAAPASASAAPSPLAPSGGESVTAASDPLARNNLFQLAAEQAQQHNHLHSTHRPGVLPGDQSGLGFDPNTLAQLQQMIQSDPGMIQALIEQMQHQNPQMASALASNPQMAANLFEEFTRLTTQHQAESMRPMSQNMGNATAGMSPADWAAMSNPGALDDFSVAAQGGGQNGADAFEVVDGMGDGVPDGVHGSLNAAPQAHSVTVSMTEADLAAISRLVDLGFERNRVIRAYIVCDKNEQLAANFLFDNEQDF